MRREPETARRIQEAILGANVPELAQSFQSVTGDRPTAAVGASVGPAGGGGDGGLGSAASGSGSAGGSTGGSSGTGASGPAAPSTTTVANGSDPGVIVATPGTTLSPQTSTSPSR